MKLTLGCCEGFYMMAICAQYAMQYYASENGMVLKMYTLNFRIGSESLNQFTSRFYCTIMYSTESIENKC